MMREGLRRMRVFWSGRRDSNRRDRPWQGRPLPTELLPLNEKPHFPPLPRGCQTSCVPDVGSLSKVSGKRIYNLVPNFGSVLDYRFCSGNNWTDPEFSFLPIVECNWFCGPPLAVGNVCESCV